ncbi:hypothetical protein LguiB_034493 [Lonicera macranthoides]
MMNKLLRQIIIILVYRISWRKLFFLGAVITLTGLVLQSPLLPYPMTKRIFDPPDTVSSYKSLNRTFRLREITLVSRGKKFESLPVASVFDSLNSSAKPNRVVPVGEEGEIVSQTSSRNRKIRAQVIAKPLSPPPPHSPPRNHTLLNYIWSLTPEEGLVYAKKEIEKASAVIDDPDLYAPLFRNVSVFKRSYELMELILKVYIYQEGKRPIFHQPYLRGIYSSEGWFMRFLEGNRQFVTRDPEKAHLFYLPYSAHQMEMALYKPDSHNIKRLSIFLRDYVNMLAAKHPFWNRTHGSDHFLVACHDWGPYTLTEHKELTKNPIKALCNADVSEGIFTEGKDVSLPETTIRNPRRPLRDLGGKRVSQRPILAFFAGKMHGRVRPILRKYWNAKDDEEMKIYGPLPKKISKEMTYAQHMKSSKFCICPMGFEVNSPRIVEAIYYECIPVIIADNFVPPLNEVLDWSAFSVIMPEKDIPKLKEILSAIPMRRYLIMQNNVKMLQKHFRWNPRPVRYDMFHMILHSIWLSRLNQIQLHESL